jgi:hypothetical protein
MPGMKITVDAAMRVRDVSRPRPDHEAAALAAEALAAADRSSPPRRRDPAPPAATAPAATAPAAPAGEPASRGRRATPDTGNQATGRAAGTRGSGGKRHRSRKRFPR